MTDQDEFVDFLLEQMQASGIDITSLRARKMFGGHGIYFNDVMFALVAEEELYFKLGDNNQQDYESAGLPRFSYERGGKRFEMSYAAAPAEIYDEPDMMHDWANAAIDAAMAANRNKKSPRKKKRA